MGQVVTRTDKLRARIAAARTAWEEMDVAYTSYDMRRRAEAYLLSLLALGRRWGVQ